ncbi:MAG: energy transducer TonB [Raineya sp.]
MLFNLTDLIFENRNKLYGAYRLRKNYFYALSIALLCNIPLLLFCIFWVKYEQKQYVEREIMLQVNEDVEIVDIDDLPVIAENNTDFSLTQSKMDEIPENKNSEEVKNPEIEVKDDAKKQDEPKEKPEEKVPQKDTSSNFVSNAEKAKPVAYSPDVWSIYVKQNLKYPPQALKEKKECNVFVAVVIKEDGTLELDKERALYGCEEYFNEEVKRLIANAPPFIPANDANGKPKTKINLKISFKLPQE